MWENELDINPGLKVKYHAKLDPHRLVLSAMRQTSLPGLQWPTVNCSDLRSATILVWQNLHDCQGSRIAWDILPAFSQWNKGDLIEVDWTISIDIESRIFDKIGENIEGYCNHPWTYLPVVCLHCPRGLCPSEGQYRCLPRVSKGNTWQPYAKPMHDPNLWVRSAKLNFAQDPDLFCCTCFASAYYQEIPMAAVLPMVCGGLLENGLVAWRLGSCHSCPESCIRWFETRSRHERATSGRAMPQSNCQHHTTGKQWTNIYPFFFREWGWGAAPNVWEANFPLLEAASGRDAMPKSSEWLFPHVLLASSNPCRWVSAKIQGLQCIGVEHQSSLDLDTLIWFWPSSSVRKQWSIWSMMLKS